ncbi:MAG: O-antigen ligase family protein [Deltaproteobacteria bacterium]|nr:O-antigen ligase family protein [Deltaproteobacteria bacterium]
MSASPIEPSSPRDHDERRVEGGGGKPRRARRASWAARVNAGLEDFPLEMVTSVLCALLVVGSMLAIGAVHPTTLLALAAGATALVFFAFALRGTERRLPVAGPLYVLWGLSLVCLLQLVPLPIAVTRVVSPTAADIWTRALGPFGEPGPSLAPLSLDPGATWVEALRWYVYGALFAGSATVSTRLGMRWASGTVFGSACLAGLVTIVHGLVGLEKVYGLYEPSFRQVAWHVGALLNPNNLAGYLNLGSLAGLGLLFEERPLLPRWMNAVGVAMLVGVNVVSASRGGVLTLLVGLVLLVIVQEVSRGRRAESRSTSRRSRSTLFGTVAFGAVLAVLGSHAKTWAELFDENLGKLAMISWVRPVLGDFPFTGVGRGAFESVFPAYQPESGGVVFTHIENFPAHWLVEWGIPVGVAALAAFAWYLRPARLGVPRSSAAAGAYCGMLALLIQNLADLGLEIPATGAAFVLLFGAMWGAAAQRDAGMLGPAVHAPRAIRLGTGLAIAGLLVAAGVWRNGMRLLDAERRELRASLTATRPPRVAGERRELRAKLRAAMLRHPAEPYFALLGAALAHEERDENPIVWLQRALERSRTNGRAHVLLAQVLERLGAKGQALMELRLAIAADPTLVDTAAQVAVDFGVDEADLARMVPAGEHAGKTWAALGARLKDQPAARRCDERALAADPSLVGPLSRLGMVLVEQRAHSRGCVADEAKCARAVEDYARRLEDGAPRSSHAGQLRARWLAATGKTDEAAALLADVCDSVEDRVPCLYARTSIAATTRSPEPLAAAERSLVTTVCAEESQCASVTDWLGNLHAGRGEWGTAANFYSRSLQHEETTEVLLKLADASSRSGLAGQALRSYERALTRRGGRDEAIEVRTRDLRKQLMSGVVR